MRGKDKKTDGEKTKQDEWTEKRRGEKRRLHEKTVEV